MPSSYREENTLKAFQKTKGTISVFLTLILLPVLIFGGMTTDASRIYMSKAVISDAGEMAMNAGLAQYNEILHDAYGLLAMDKPPEAMKSELKQYFNGSLNGTGLPGAEDYDKILELLEKKFEAINVQGSEIYRTEVEKQQILEYMKYRAPVCLTELVVEKLKELKNTKQMIEAMQAQMDFSEAMEDCQGLFEETKAALDVLDGKINAFPASETIKDELSNAQKDYKEIVAKCLLMRAAIQNYDKKAPDTNKKLLEEQFIEHAKKVDLSKPYDPDTFENYIASMYYKNAITALGELDGDEESEESGEGEEGEEGEGQEGEEGEPEEVGGFSAEYEEQAKRIEGYANTLLETAKGKADIHTAQLSQYWATTAEAAEAAGNCCEKLEDLKEKLKKAESEFFKWSEKNDALKALGKDTGSMDSEVDEYREFFSDGDGKKDVASLQVLLDSVQEDKNYFEEWRKILESEKFFGKPIATTPSQEQLSHYNSNAKNAVSGIEANYSSLEETRGKYIAYYECADTSNPYSRKEIYDDPFYVRIREYCQEQSESSSSKEKEKEANEKLDDSKEAGEAAKSQEGYPQFHWSDSEEARQVQLPSSQLENDASKVGEELADLASDGNVKKNRRSVLQKFRESMQSAATFLNAVDRLAEKALENLYIAEYAMQMFSYYTVGMEDGQNRADADIISLSGYGMTGRPAYRAECEYILWGKQESQQNIQDTIMLIFGIRLLFNSFFAFTDGTIDGIALASASLIAGLAPYLVPVIKVVVKLGFAGVETANDIERLKQGYGVAIIKNARNWATAPYSGDSALGVTFDYSEYLRVFLNVSLIDGKEAGILGRIADCIQVNEPGTNLLESYTMISLYAEVSSKTTFMRKVSDWSGSGAWGFPDDTYTITYQSVLGY